MGAVSVALVTLFVGMAIGMPLCWLSSMSFWAKGRQKP